MTQSRLTTLQSVQALTEIHDFLQFIRGEGEPRREYTLGRIEKHFRTPRRQIDISPTECSI